MLSVSTRAEFGQSILCRSRMRKILFNMLTVQNYFTTTFKCRHGYMILFVSMSKKTWPPSCNDECFMNKLMSFNLAHCPPSYLVLFLFQDPVLTIFTFKQSTCVKNRPPVDGSPVSSLCPSLLEMLHCNPQSKMLYSINTCQ